MPSGNSVAALNLLRLALLTGDEAHRERAEGLFAIFSGGLSRGGSGLGRMLSALDFYLDTPLEVVIATDAEGAPGGLLPAFRGAYLPNRTLSFVDASTAAAHAALVPLVEGKVALAGAPTAFVCERGHCELPTSDPAVFRQQLAKIVPLMETPAAPLPLGQARPAPWFHDRETNRHWHPGHSHWHQGPPPPPGERQ